MRVNKNFSIIEIENEIHNVFGGVFGGVMIVLVWGLLLAL